MSFLKSLPSRTDFCSGGYSAVNQFYIQTYQCTHDQAEPDASQKIKNNPRQLLIKLPRSPVADKEENNAPLPDIDEKMAEHNRPTKKRPLNMIINKETEERKSKRIKSTAREPELVLASIKYTPMKKNDKKIVVSLRSSSKMPQTDQQKENKINTAATKQPTTKLTQKKAEAINTIAEKNQLRHTKELLGLLFGKSRKKKSTN